MTPVRPLFAASLLLVSLLAGCTGGGDGDAPDEFGDGFDDIVVTADTGAVRGIVVDTTITPVDGVSVSLQGTERSTTTDVEGRFVFDRLEPGSYFLQAQKPGFSTIQQSVDVQAGVRDPPVVRLLLERDPGTAPYILEFQFDGFIECSFSLVAFGLAACGLLPEGASNDQFLVEYDDLDAGPMWVQSEMVWQSTQQVSEELTLLYTAPGEDALLWNYAEAEGRSPLVVSVNQTLAEEVGLGAGQELMIRVFNAPIEGTRPSDPTTGEPCVPRPALGGCLTGVGMTLQQDFTVYTHVFYHFLPDEGWQFSVDGTPRSPV